MARFLPILAMVVLTFAILPNAGCGKGIFTEATVSPTATRLPTAVPSATPSSVPLGQAFSMRGSSSQTSAIAGTCSGQTCNASQGNCECISFQGTLLSTVMGTLNWTANVTVNLDDCSNTGTAGGNCCFSDGLFSATSGSGASASVLAAAISGPECIDSGASAAASLEANFAVLPASSTGKFANSTGTGQFNLFANSSDGSGYLFLLGQILLGGK
jgi:hypothetical protein